MQLITLFITSGLAFSPQQKKDTTTPATKQLKEVNVTATTPPITVQAGVMTLNISKSATAAGSNAWETLQRAPGVIADNTDNLQLNGKSVNVYIDGRPSRLSGEDLKVLLSSTPASNIDKIELMSNPSAKYDAQGAAIINIKLLKSKDLGTNGTLNLTGGFGRYLRTAEGFTLNHRSAKVNIYGGYDHLYNKQFTHSTTTRLFEDGYKMEDSDFNREERNAHNVKAGVDVDINKTTSTGILLKGTFSNRGRFGENNTGLGVTADSTFFQLANGDQSISNPSVNVYFKTGNAKKNTELSINADYFSYKKDWNDQFDAMFLNRAQQQLGGTNYIRNNSVSDIELYSLSADYTHPFKFAKLEAGLKTTFTETDNDMTWENQVNGNWVNDDGKTNHFIYKENINAAYAGLTKMIKKFTFNTALRMEHTHMQGNSITINSTFDRDYVQLFPTVSISYMKNMANTWNLSYRRSINRFGYEIVNPFITYKNAYTYQQGNPDIKPVLNQSIELTWSYKFQLFTTAGYMRSKDNLSVVFRQDPKTRVLVHSYDNQANVNVAYVMSTFTRQVFKKLRTIWVARAMYIDMDATLDGLPYNKQNLGAMLITQNTLTLPKGFSAELNATYQSPFNYGYVNLRSQGFVDLGVKKTILKGDGTLKLAANDIFNTKQMRIGVNYGNIDNFTNLNMDTRLVNLNFTYKFGNKNVKQTKVRKNTIETEASRTSAPSM